VPHLVRATVGLKNEHTAGLLVHIQLQSRHKDSTLQNFPGSG
jgi:hypothetical protein